MDAAAVLAVVVQTKGITSTNAGLTAVQGNLKKTEAAGMTAGKRLASVGKIGAAALGVGLVVGIAKSSSAAADFEVKMDRLGATTQSNEKIMKRMEKQALRLGASTVFSAGEAADAQIELAKGGLTASKILKGALPAALDLAAAGEMGLAEAAETTVNAMKLFDVQAKASGKVADMLATAANTTTADVKDFALALKQGGAASKIAGADLNEAVTILEALAEAGVRGSDAGTSMKAFFLNIATPSLKAQKAMQRLGMDIFTAKGELKSLPQLSKNLRSSFGDLTKEEFLENAGVIAGSDAIRTLYALYDAGPAKLRKLMAANEKQGTAARTAAEKNDNLRGDLEALGGAIETLQIKAGTDPNKLFRKIVQGVTEGINAITEFDFGKAGVDVGDFLDIDLDTSNFGKAFENIGKGLVWTANNVIKPAIGAIDFLFRDQLKGVVDLVTGTAETLAAVFSGDWGKAFDGLKKVVGGAFMAAFGPVIAVVRGLVGLLPSVLQFMEPVTNAFRAAGEWVGRAASNVADFITDLLPLRAVMSVVSATVPVAFAAFKVAISPAVVAVKGFIEYIKVLGNIAKGVLVPAFSFVGGVLKGLVTVAINGVRAAIRSAVEVIKNFGAVFGNIVGVVTNLLRGNWSAAWRNMRELVKSSLNLIKSLWTGTWNVAKSVFSSSFGFIKTTAKNGMNTVKTIIRNVGNAIPDIFRSAWGTVKGVFVSGANAIIGVVNAVIDVINKIPGVNIGKVGKLMTDKEIKDIHKDPNPGSLGRQTGGIVPGAGTGDRWKKALPAGSYVLNKKATEAFGLGRQTGGMVPTILEPGERYFMPHEVKKIGLGNLEAMNNTVKRFQNGGPVDNKRIPRTGGPLDVAGNVVDAGVNVAGNLAGKAAGKALGKGASFFIDRLPKPNIPQPLTPVGPWMIDQVKEWIKNKVPKAGTLGSASGSLAAFEALGHSYGLQTTSGYRPGDDGYHGVNRARDLSNGSGPTPEMLAFAQDAAARWGRKMLELIYTPLGWAIKNGQKVPPYAAADHYDHVHGAFNLGGLVQALYSGGQVRVAKNVFAHLLKKGFDFRASAGVVGNAYREGLWNPAQMEYTGAHNGGLYGFTTPPVSLQNLKDWAKSRGKPWDDEIVQTNFMLTHGQPTGYAIRGAMNALDTIPQTTDYFMTNWERPAASTAALDVRIKAAYDAAKFMQSIGVTDKESAEEWNGKAGGGMTDAEKERLARIARKKHRIEQIEKLNRQANKAETIRGKKSALWKVIGAYGRFGKFDKKSRSHLMDVIRDVASNPNPNSGVKKMRALSKYLEKNVKITGVDEDDWQSLTKDIERVRERASKRAERKKARIFKRISGRGLNYPQKEFVMSMGRKIDLGLEQADIMEKLHVLQQSEFGSDLSDNEINLQVGKNSEVLSNMIKQVNSAFKGQKWLEGYIKRTEKKISKIKKDPQHPERWKLKAYRDGLSNARTSLGETRDKVIELRGISGQGGAILDQFIKIADLKGTPSAEAAAASENAAAMAELHKEQARLANLRYAVLERQYAAFSGIPGLPFMGAFRKGGVALLGENGPELAHIPSGTRIHNAGETQAILGSAQSSGDVFVEVNVYEDTGHIGVKVNGKEAEAAVKRVSRKNARKVGSTPGRGGVR